MQALDEALLVRAEGGGEDADFIGGHAFLEAAGVADDAGEAVGDFHAPGDVVAVAHDAGRRGAVEAVAEGVGDVIAEHSIGQGEDEFPAGVLKSESAAEQVRALGAEGKLEQIAAGGAGFEVVGNPVAAAAGEVVALHHAIGEGDAALAETGADGVAAGEVVGHIHPELALKFLEAFGQAQDVVIERRAGGIGGQPVAADDGHGGVASGAERGRDAGINGMWIV